MSSEAPEPPRSSAPASTIERIGDAIHRPSGPWTPQVHRLLCLLHARGVAGTPQPLGMDEHGREVLSYLHGEAGASPLAGAQRDDAVVQQAAQLLKTLHDATAEVVANPVADTAASWSTGWRVPAQAPAEVICHGDFAPYNCAFQGGRLVGVFDFDYAHPAPRLWDIAYAVYRFAPLADPVWCEGFGTPPEQARRLRLFCDAYGLHDRSALVDAVITRVGAMADHLLAGLQQRDPRRMAAVRAGHLQIYQRDRAYIQRHRATWNAAL